jgi:hypothetical protein
MSKETKMSSLKEKIAICLRNVNTGSQLFQYNGIKSLTNEISAKCIQGGRSADEFSWEEEDGVTAFTVYKFTDNHTKESAFVEFVGTYSSYDGLKYTSWDFVTPVEKKVIVYEKE